MEDALDAWRHRGGRDDDRLEDMSDGRLWKTLPGADGRPFFDNDLDRPDQDVLKLGLILSSDGFSCGTSRQAGSHSSDQVSISIANLPVQLRCRPRNYMLCGIYPGPNVPNAEQLQSVLKAIVDDVGPLYDTGITLKTPKYPNGRLVKAVILAVSCDHPALCKVAGFADHGHALAFCPKCKARRCDLQTQDGVGGGFEAKTNEEYRTRGLEYYLLEESQKNAYFKAHGIRFSELMRLPYFDGPRMVIIDPMHCIFLGIGKTWWLDAWIKKKVLRRRTATGPKLELDFLNDWIKTFEIPTWVGRMPSRLGYTSGGSLTADEYRVLLLVFLPVVAPFIWGEWQPRAENEYAERHAAWERGAYRQTDEAPKRWMEKSDLDHFLLFAAAVKTITARSVTVPRIHRAREQLRAALLGFLQNHQNCVKPNFHWVTHMFDQLLDYGPVHGFWSFPMERLNKVLKNFNTNHRDNGEMEVTFMREIERDKRLRVMLVDLSRSACRWTAMVADIMLKADQENRGTVAGMAGEIEEGLFAEEDSIRLGDSVLRELGIEFQKILIKYYNVKHPDARVLPLNAVLTRMDKDPNFLSTSGFFYRFVKLNGKRIVPSEDAYYAPNGMIQVRWNGGIFVGQVVAIFKHEQKGIPSSPALLHVRWFRPLPITFGVWNNFPELEVGLWKFNEYFNEFEDEGAPPSLISPEEVLTQVCRLRLVYKSQRTDENGNDVVEEIKLWATIGLSKNATDDITDQDA